MTLRFGSRRRSLARSIRLRSILVRSAARALSEHFGEVVWAHAGDCTKSREAEIVTQVIANMIKHTLEAKSWQTYFVDHRGVPPYGVSIEQIYGQRIGQRFAINPPRG